MRLTLNATAAERFWPKVDMAGDCWVWTARRDVDGYGRFRPDGANTGDVGAHRVALARGETQVSIAKRYGTAQAVISMIVLRKSWTHID